MKILLDARESGTTTGRYVDKLIEYLHQLKSGHEFVVLTKTHRLDFIRKLAPTYTVLETPYKEFTFGEQMGFCKQIANIKPDLVHFTMVQQPLRYHGKVVTTMQDLTTCRFRNPSKNWLVFTLKQQVYKAINWYVPRKSTKIITPTDFVKRDVMDFAHVGPEKFTVTHEAADPIPDSPTALPALQNKQFIMYVGRPTPHKNLWRLIEAFVILRQQHPSLFLALAGKKDVLYQQIEERVKLAGIEGVIFTDFVSEGELRWMYEQTAAYAFPSLSEGWGLPGLEAAMHGAPVACSHATCLPEVYKDGALYFDPLNPQDIADKLHLILTHKTVANELRVKGLAVAKSYSWRRMAEQTLAVYEQALKT